MDEPTENTRLLPPVLDPAPEQGGTPDAAQKEDVQFHPQNLVSCALVILTYFVLAAGSILLVVPLNAILETNICRRLHPDRPMPDASYCEGDLRVQEELALIRGWELTFELLPGILVALPYGILADKYGRKPMLVLCLFGVHLYAAFLGIICWWPYAFPVRMVWLPSLCLFVGGGIAVLVSLLYSILADLVPGQYHALAFSCLGAAGLIATLFTPSIAATLMDPNPWLPFLIGEAFYPLAVIMAFFVPETKSLEVAALNDGPDGHEQGSYEEQPARPTQSVQSRMKGSIVSFSKSVAVFAKGNPRVIILALTLLTSTFGKMVQEVLLQYAKHRFDWPWYRVGYLLSYEAAVELLLLLGIVPTANYFMVTRWSLSTKKKDMFIVRVSATSTVLGLFTMAIVTTKALFLTGLGVYALGAVNGLVMRSLLVQLVEQEHRGILFTSLSVVEELSSVTAGPVLAFCLRASFHMEGILRGLPFLVGGLLSLITLVTVLSIKV